MRRSKIQPLLVAGLLLLSLAPPLMAGERVGSFVAATSQRFVFGSENLAIYVTDVSAGPPVTHGPFFEKPFANGFRLTLLRDEPAGIVDDGAQLYRIDFSDPAAPAIVATATLPFDPRDVTRLADSRDELLAVGPGGELALIDPRTLGIRASFTLPSPRIRVRTSGDGRLLLTQDSGSGVFLASFDAVLGAAAEVELQASGFTEAAFSRDNRTLILHDSFCFITLLGPPFCQTYLTVYDVTDPASPVFADQFDYGLDLITSSALDRGGGRIYFHQRGNHEWQGNVPHRLLVFGVAGAGSLSPLFRIALSSRGGFEASGMVRTAGAEELLVFASQTKGADPAVGWLHRYTLATGAVAVSPLPLPLEPRGVFHIGAAIFADGFESGTTGAWGPADL